MKITLDTYVISDTHFGQDSIHKKEPIRRVIANNLGYEDCFSLMVDNWNREVSPKDSVLHLGDVYCKDGLSYLKKLNGKKRLVIGNNDIKKVGFIQKLGWKAKNKVVLKIPQKEQVRALIHKKYPQIKDDIFLNGIIIDIAGERILFSHFPVFNRKNNDRFAQIRDVLDDYFRLSDCSLNIHGHTHSRDTNNPFCINVSAEKTMLTPLPLKQILKRKF